MSSRRLPGALQEFREVAKLYPMIQAQEMIVDNTCMQLVGKPNQFDVMVRSTAPWCRVGRHVHACAGLSSACMKEQALWRCTRDTRASSALRRHVPLCEPAVVYACHPAWWFPQQRSGVACVL